MKIFLNFSHSVSFLVGVITFIAGLTGVLAGAEISRRLKSYCNNREALVCAYGILCGGPFLYGTLYVADKHVTLCWVRPNMVSKNLQNDFLSLFAISLFNVMRSYGIVLSFLEKDFVRLLLVQMILRGYVVCCYGPKKSFNRMQRFSSSFLL